MRLSDYERLLAQLKRDEGTVRDADGNHVTYLCPAGRRTIGYGHNLDANPVPGINGVISDDQAERLLKADVMAAQQHLEAAIPWAHTLSPARRAVLVNMAFNLGVTGVLRFTKMLCFARVGDYRNAAKEMRRSLWARQVRARANRLAAQMETGLWQ